METCYISCGCNRAPNSLDWGKNNVVCYGARNAVAFYDPKALGTGRVYQTLHKHTNNVTVVRWIKTTNEEFETELISGSIDCTAIIWTRSGDSYAPSATLEDTSAVRLATAQYLVDEKIPTEKIDRPKLLVCTGNTDGDVKIWLRARNGNTRLSQTMKFEKKLPLEIAACFLPNSNNTLLAVALEDSSIRLITGNGTETEKEPLFVQVQTLIGHEDWVRCLDLVHDNNGDVLLASGSQDSMIRLWRISEHKIEGIGANNEGGELEQKKEIFSNAEVQYNVGLESILISHDGWVYGLNWHPAVFLNGERSQPMKLLSCSLDKTMILWEPDEASGIWLESVRVGDVGGNSLGFYGCKFGPEGNSLLAHGYQGSFHVWNYSEKSGNWSPSSAPSGHFSEVVDLCWDPEGRFLLTTSLDQTTRAHAPWKYNSRENWHEIGRPQVHGYDMSCVSMLTPYVFASGAEEKVVRTFSAPSTFVNYLKRLSNADDCPESTAESASVPALGLTNKAVFDGDILPPGDNLYIGNSRDLDFDKPPTEEELIQHTLWPELQKLYGHGYEIFTIAARTDGSILATACKSSSVEHAAIILWDRKSWKIQQKLVSHQLTVTQLAFSPDDKYLLSVSRDRRWSLFASGENGYELKAASSKKDSLHSRIIWCCAWSHDSKYFATGSRDGKIGIWKPAEFKDKEFRPFTSIEAKDASVTALAFAGVSPARDSYVLAIGFESGNIEIHKLLFGENSRVFRKYESLDTSRAHHLTVRRLSFRPQTEYSQTKILQLASCGSDNFVKIHNFSLEDISLL